MGHRTDFAAGGRALRGMVKANLWNAFIGFRGAVQGFGAPLTKQGWALYALISCGTAPALTGSGSRGRIAAALVEGRARPRLARTWGRRRSARPTDAWPPREADQPPVGDYRPRCYPAAYARGVREFPPRRFYGARRDLAAVPRLAEREASRRPPSPRRAQGAIWRRACAVGRLLSRGSEGTVGEALTSKTDRGGGSPACSATIS